MKYGKIHAFSTLQSQERRKTKYIKAIPRGWNPTILISILQLIFQLSVRNRQLGSKKPRPNYILYQIDSV